MTAKDEHGDRMKGYEAQTDIKLDPHLPIYARIDGRSFSHFTRGMKRPYDERMVRVMQKTMLGLAEKTNPRCIYTQSDEIGIMFLAGDKENSGIFFEGRHSKLVSVLASLTTALFHKYLAEDPELAEYAARLPHFDCRVCQLPNKEEAANMMLWRYKDAQKNFVSSAAQAVFSHKQLQGKKQQQMIDMLRTKGINYLDYPGFLVHGTFARRHTELRSLTDEELVSIPEKHRPTEPFERTSWLLETNVDFRNIDRVAYIFGEK